MYVLRLPGVGGEARVAGLTQYVRVNATWGWGSRSLLMTAEDAKLAADDMVIGGNLYAMATSVQVPNEDGELETVYARLDPATVSA